MFYYLFEYLDKIDFAGAGLFKYISFRAAAAAVTSLIVSMIFGKRIIKFLQKKQVGEVVRDLGLEGQYEKKGTPTMGGIIIIAAILIPVILFAKLDNIYIILMIITTVWMGIIGFIDDYIKVFRKNKAGLSGKYKIFGQITLGLIVGLTFYFSDNIQVRENPVASDLCNTVEVNQKYYSQSEKPLKTTIPFVKNNEFDYKKLTGFLGENSEVAAWVVFIFLVIIIITAVSNGANMTDGLDGLAAGTSSIIGAALAVFAYVSGNLIFADYLNIMYIPNIGELTVFAAAFMGAAIGFLWYNSYPAQVFMGDTGSLTIGGIIAVFAIIVRKELLIPLLAGIFLAENLSVMLQVGWFKYTKKKYGEGKRIFLMAPLHHHFQKKGLPEPKIVSRFWITGILLAIITILTLKIR
ncbi:MAG: phospho-N-acetylmuramoyl-pentapeptide-transferase [Chlorobi bacterium]|nr:phospho-N-acetylmuramoyl-pentapeptide-transferase [Chlorobiota bacterium]